MKKTILFILAAFAAISASAQYTCPDAVNKDMLRHTTRTSVKARNEIVIPQVNGYNVYKADFHTHSIYSDAQTTPEWRVTEAWYDGLDILAITEHIEYRPTEPKMLEFLKAYAKKNAEAVNYDIVYQGKGNDGIMADLNFAVKCAQAATKDKPMLIIPGTEITRAPKEVGHFNALFTKDNNTIPTDDPLQALRNAKAQGALIQHNHPGWLRKSIDMNEFEIQAYKENLIDGIEVMNGPEFYPAVIDRAREKGLFITANTDIHGTTELDYAGATLGRNMTFVLAKENTLEAVREALEAHRTIAYAYDQLCGSEALLKALFSASVKFTLVRIDSKGRSIFNITNMSSIPFAVSLPGRNPIWIDPFTTVQTKSADLTLTVLNMWYGEKAHPQVQVKF